MRAGGLQREMDWLGGRMEDDLLRSRFSACSQRFFRALRLPNRKVGVALSTDCEEEKKKLKEVKLRAYQT